MVSDQNAHALADQIAGQVIADFNKLPSKGKPIVKSNGVKEWTVLAGIVALHDSDDLETASIVTIAITTGVKALPDDIIAKHSKGRLLHDCHAEILAIRALNRFLIDECMKVTQGIEESRYLHQAVNGGKFHLRDGISFALYVSEPPCGDCSLELLHGEDDPDWELDETVELTGGVLRGRDNYRISGRVRSKPGRRDSPMTLSKSCSDKLTVCQLKSLLNGMSSQIIDPKGIYLRFLVVPGDRHNEEGSQRCFRDRFRVESVEMSANYELNYFDTIRTGQTHQFQKSKEATPSATSLIHLPHDHIQESIQKGLKEGFYSKKQYVRPNGESLLCRYQLFKQIQPLLLSYTDHYTELKKSNTEYQSIKLLAQEALLNWCKTATDDFKLD